MDQQLLTIEEREALALSGSLANRLRRIIGEGPNRVADWDEAAIHVHSIQHMIMAQAAARAYPHDFRLLGQTIHSVASQTEASSEGKD